MPSKKYQAMLKGREAQFFWVRISTLYCLRILHYESNMDWLLLLEREHLLCESGHETISFNSMEHRKKDSNEFLRR